jgi:DNA invertase Pin-like site-specific DNA recombinase
MTTTNGKPPRVAAYIRVSTLDQHPENQRAELRRYIEARGWTLTREYTDQGISGSADRRRALDELIRDARLHRFDAIVCWKLDRLGRSIRHLVTLLDELRAIGIGFTTLSEGIDTTTPAGRMVSHFLAAVAEFERERLRERTFAGLARARAQGKRLGRRRKIHPRSAALDAVADLSHAQAAKRLDVSIATIKRLRRERRQPVGSESPAVA